MRNALRGLAELRLPLELAVVRVDPLLVGVVEADPVVVLGRLEDLVLRERDLDDLRVRVRGLDRPGRDRVARLADRPTVTVAQFPSKLAWSILPMSSPPPTSWYPTMSSEKRTWPFESLRRFISMQVSPPGCFPCP